LSQVTYTDIHKPQYTFIIKISKIRVYKQRFRTTASIYVVNALNVSWKTIVNKMWTKFYFSISIFALIILLDVIVINTNTQAQILYAVSILFEGANLMVW